MPINLRYPCLSELNLKWKDKYLEWVWDKEIDKQ